jgi:outer membrane protein assembly factor BamB
LREIWSQSAGKGNDIDSHITSAPVVGGGLIYALDAEAHVFAFSAGDGHAVWDRQLAPKNGTGLADPVGPVGQAQHSRSAARHGRRRRL